MKSDSVLGLMNAGWPSLLVDDTGVIREVNKAGLDAFGPALSDGTAPFAALWSEENEISTTAFLRTPPPAGNTLVKLRCQDGMIRSYQACICKAQVQGAQLNLVQLLAPMDPAKGSSLEAGLAHKQKLDCALQLARTVSLDFNNALTSILGHASLVLSKMEPDNPWRKSLMEVEKSAEKAAEIANDLGAFSRSDKEPKQQLAGNLNLLLQRNTEMFRASKLDKEVAWSLQLERRIYTAKFDEAKLQQALVKVMENAVESLNERGTIILQSRNIDLTEPTQDRNTQLAAGAYVCVEITDNGCGIEAEILPRIFEPFFTTKRATKHRGLGLAWVYGIVTNHGGGVAVSSQAGVGTSVRIYLPADKKFVKESVSSADDLHGTENILMVDDEDLMLTMGHAVLSAYGYQVQTANSGQKALEMIAQSKTPIDLVITDLVMPSMSGRELVEHVRRLSPDTRILCSSGYVRPNPADQDDAGYLQKPFTSQELLLKVKQAMTAAEPTIVD